MELLPLSSQAPPSLISAPDGSRPGSTSSIPLGSSSLPYLSRGYQWTHSGTYFMRCLFRNRLYPCDFHRLQAGGGPAWGRLLRLLSLVAAPLSLPLRAGSSPCGPQGPADLAGDLSPLPPSSLPRSWSIQEGKGGRREEQVPCSLRFSTALIGSVTFPKCLPQGLPPIGLLVTIFSNPGGES